MPTRRVPKYRALTLLTWALLASCAVGPAPVPYRSGVDLADFNRTVRPQDNLYDFVSGAWLASTQVPADQSNYGTFAQLNSTAQSQLHRIMQETLRSRPAAGSEERKAVDFYRSFMDVGRIEALGLAPLRRELQHIDALASSADVVRYMGYNQTIGISEPLAWSAPQDPGDARSYITEIDQSGLTMPDRDYYLLDGPAYRDYRSQLVTYIGRLLSLAGASELEAGAGAQAVMAIETQLAQAQWSRVENRDPIKTYNPADAWRRPRSSRRRSTGARCLPRSGSPVDRFVVSQPSFISALGRMTVTVPVGDWRIYFRYKLLDAYAPFLPAAFDQLYFDFHQRTLLGVQLQRPRWERALAALNGNIGEIVGRLYVARHFPPRSRRRITLLVGNLLQAYARSIEQLDWMDPQTRAQAQLKLSKLTAKIGYPNKWRNYSALRVSADDLIGNLVRSGQFELHRQAARLGAPVDREEWQLTPQTVNAYYDLTLNEIVFPAAILQPPFFDARADDAANYGAIGAVIGHEISHGFDDQGRQFDGDGNLR